TKNTLTVHDVTASSHRKAWWICVNNHSYEMMIFERVKTKFPCQKCNLEESNLEKNFPTLVEEWHPIKNEGLLPSHVTYGSDKKVWWLCKKKHEWLTSISCRTIMKHNCPYCSGKQICETNSLLALYPAIAEQWHPTKNGALTPADVIAGTNKKVWWICLKGHEWETTIYARVAKKSGCLYCCNLLITKEESLEYNYPHLLSEWDYNKNIDVRPDNVA